MSGRKRKATRARTPDVPIMSGNVWTEHRAKASAYGQDGRVITVTLEQHFVEGDERAGVNTYVAVRPTQEHAGEVCVASRDVGLLAEALCNAVAEGRRTGMLPKAEK